MLVEVHPFGHLTALLLHMISVVPFEWRFVYVGSKESLARVKKSIPIRDYEKSGKLVLREVPAGFDATNNEGMHRMLTHMRFYEEVVDPAEWLLLFRADTILCAQSNQSLNDWLEYDWVGAPWSVIPLFPFLPGALRAPRASMFNSSPCCQIGVLMTALEATALFHSVEYPP